MVKHTQARTYLLGSLFVIGTLAIRMLLAQRKQAEAELKAIAWLLQERKTPFTVPDPQPYGELTDLNSKRTILRTVGKELLVTVASDALHLIGTSGAVCEKNGDYASCLVASDWCRFLDQASRARCSTSDNQAALASGEWHCRESCREVSARSMETGRPADIRCKGGINLYAAPIKIDDETLGSITMGYGDPPKDDERLMEVAARYGVELEKLRQLSAHMPSRPQFIVAVAKARLRNEAILLGEIIKRKRAEEALADLTKNLEERIGERTQQLRILAAELNLAEQRERKRLAVELHDYLQQLLVLGKLKMGEGKRYTNPIPAWMKQVDEVLSDALNYTRTLVAELSPPVLRQYGLLAGLKWLGEYMQKHSITVTVRVPESAELAIPEDHAVVLFQSVRELLINSSKYAGTGEATVTLEQRDDRLRIQVRDQGAGFDVTAVGAAVPAGVPTGGLSSKFGLLSIRERMKAMGGAFDIQSAPGMGTTASLILPLSHKAAGEVSRG